MQLHCVQMASKPILPKPEIMNLFVQCLLPFFCYFPQSRSVDDSVLLVAFFFFHSFPFNATRVHSWKKQMKAQMASPCVGIGWEENTRSGKYQWRHHYSRLQYRVSTEHWAIHHTASLTSVVSHSHNYIKYVHGALEPPSQPDIVSRFVLSNFHRSSGAAPPNNCIFHVFLAQIRFLCDVSTYRVSRSQRKWPLNY